MTRENICVVFDLDDTLYLERDFVCSGFRAVDEWCAANLGITGVRENAEALFTAGERKQIFDMILARLGVNGDAGILSQIVRVYREHIPAITLRPDSIECLKRLEGRVSLCLLTDGRPITQWNKIDALGLRRQFEVIVVTGEWGEEFFKPHPRGYKFIEERAPLCRGRFVYVADNPAKDFLVPQELGWTSLRVRRPNGLHELRESPAGFGNFEVSSLATVPDLLSQLFAVSF